MGGRGADEEEPQIYLPEMATGTVMWNVYGGLYVEADLYASRWREGWTRISARLCSTRAIIAR